MSTGAKTCCDELIESRATIVELDLAGTVLCDEIDRLRALLDRLVRDPRVPKAAIEDAIRQ